MKKSEETIRILVTNIKFTAAGPEDRTTGLLGFVSVVYDGSLALDGLTIRRAASDAHLYISFPARRDAHGGEHPYVRPLTDRVRREIEEQVLDALAMR